MFLLCLNSFISVSWLCCFFTELFYKFWCWTNFFNSFSRIWLSFNSFYFSFKINNFLYSSNLLWFNYTSMFWIFSFQPFSESLLSCSNSFICSSISAIIYTVTMFGFCPFLIFFLFSSILCSIYFIFVCFVTYCSWFFLKTRSFSTNFSDRILHSSLIFDSCSFNL